MHALGRYLLTQMDAQNMRTAELIRLSGLSKQTIYNLINDPRDHMDQTPQRKTVTGLAKALGVSEVQILTESARAIGVPIGDDRDSLRDASNEELLRVVLSRMTDPEESDGRGKAASMNQSAGDPGGNNPTTTQPDPGVGPAPEPASDVVDDLATRRAHRNTTRERAGVVEPVGAVGLGEWVDDDDGDALPDDLAAYAGYSEGMRVRDAIDAAGEESQDPEGKDD
ncbi:helix-turn-helix domain-containing protein [Kocuria sp.]|uniref:helix-turn-helix domain-containing protein n=1 Tax=Kocuria sp. TaxID=1871328 RepID=UPI0026DFACDC|nr:helix-turn-helix transcriptional regulator [Kocuria sp.]MDO5619305.1 helix-turn-helix transcriptional regulator [Kocuria sp.]